MKKLTGCLCRSSDLVTAWHVQLQPLKSAVAQSDKYLKRSPANEDINASHGHNINSTDQFSKGVFLHRSKSLRTEGGASCMDC